MSFEHERVAIEGRFAANYTATPIKYANKKFEPPKTTAWVALTILTGIGRQASLGASNPLHRFTGVIQIDVFAPEDTGTATARGHADTIGDIYRRQQFSYSSSGTITCDTPYITDRGIENGWHRLVVSIPYRRDVHLA